MTLSPIEERLGIAAGMAAALREKGDAPGVYMWISHYVAEVHRDLVSASKIVDPAANAAWNFADYYCLDLEHHEPTVEGIPWDEARQLYRSTIAILETGSGELDPRVMDFEWPRGQRPPPPRPPLRARFAAWLRRLLSVR